MIGFSRPALCRQFEDGRIAERNRNHGGCEIFLIPVLVKSHFGTIPIEVHQTGFRRMGIV